MTNDTDCLITVEEFADRMKVSRTTVFAWLKKGDLQEGFHYLRLGRIIRFRWREDMFFTDQEHPRTTPDELKKRKPPAGTASTGGVNLEYAM